MKKNILLLFGIATLAAILSCEKEEEIKQVVTDDTHAEISMLANIPTSLSAAYTDTKTVYDEDGKFSWEVGDEIDLIFVLKEAEAIVSQGWVAYEIANSEALKNEGRAAIFTIKDGQDAKTNASTGALKGYENTHLAVYGKGASHNSVARPYLEIDNTIAISEFAAPIITLQQSISGTASEIILLGDESEGVFSFQTACAVLKVTLSSIPASATELRLYTTDTVNSPIDGDFVFDDNKVIRKGDYKKYGSGNIYDSCHSYISAATGGESEKTFYFNIPTGKYAANTLKIRLLDADKNVLMQKGIGVEWTFNRNDLVETALECPTTSSVYTGSYATAPKLYTTKGSGVTTIRVNISSDKLTDGNYTKSGWKEGNRFADNQTGWNLAGLKNTSEEEILSTATSGQYYLNWIACSNGTQPDNLTDNQVVAFGSAPMAYITSADAALRCGHYDYASGTIAPTAMAAKPEEGSITLAVSKDASKGNLMITEFGCYSYKYNGYYNTTIGQTPTSDGSPVYGLYKASNSSTGNHPGAVFDNTFDNCFFKVSSTNYYLGAKGSGATATRLRLSFNNDAWSTGSTKDLVCWDGKATLFYTENKSSSKIEIQNYCANLNLINKCTISSNSESGSDVATNMADGDPETYWHSVWSGTLPFDSTYGVYITIALPSALKTFQISYLTRLNNNVVPRSFKYWTSTDGAEWTPYSENEEDATTNITGAGTRVTLPSVTPASSFKYIRVRIVKANASGVATELTSSSGSTAIAELQLYGSAE